MCRVAGCFGIFCLLLLVVQSAHTPAAPDDRENAFALPATDDGLPGEGPIRRYDWFRTLWEQRRAGFASEVTSKQDAVVFFGDSITQGWGPDFGGHFPGLHAANRGISGDTTRGMLIRLEEDVLALNPAAVVLLMGTNDLEELAEPEVIASNIDLIISALTNHNAKMPIVLCQVFPSSAALKRSVEDITKLNQLMAASVRDKPQVIVLDTWKLFADKQGNAKKTEFPDLLHPNRAGYAKWAKALNPILATLGFTETKPDDFRAESGFRSLFNGRDLTGWGYRPLPPRQLEARRRWRARNPDAPPWPIVDAPVWFTSASTPDGRYIAKNGRLIVATPAEGRRIQTLWTREEFPGDFTLKLDFRATPNADSGVFLRAPQLQCRDYLLAGPYTNLKHYRPQDWNELVVTVKNNVARCTCNGELLEKDFQLPDSGPIGLEGDRGQMEYRRIRIRRTPAD